MQSDHHTPTSASGQTITTCAWQMTYLKPTQREISLQVYYTDHDIPRHAPMLNGMHFKQPGAGLKDEFEEWGDELVLPLPDLEALGFELMENVRGEEVYELHYRVVLKCRAADVQIKWQVARPGVEIFGEFTFPSFLPSFLPPP